MTKSEILNKMMANKTDTVGKLTSGIAGLFKKNKVDHFFGEARFLNNKTIEVNQKKFKADKILIATGSVPSTIPGIDIDEKNIVSSTGALEFEKSEAASGNSIRQVVLIKQGVDREIAQKIVKAIKSSKSKTQTSIQGDEVRVSGKKRDDLQAAIKLIKGLNIKHPLQYENFRD